MRGRRFLTQADIDRYIAQGYGQGEGESYKPWVRVQDVPSQGRSHQVPGIKVDRVYHTLSDLEYAYLLVLEFSEQVVDIREQYPLLPVESAQRIAAEHGIDYPRYVSSRVPFVLSTDFLVTYLDGQGQKHLAARAVKYRADISPGSPNVQRTLEKLEIERWFWGAEDWQLVTEDCIGKETLQNLAWLSEGALIPTDLGGAEVRLSFLEVLEDLSGSERMLSSLLRTAGTAVHLTYPQSIALFKHLVWIKTIRFDLRTQPLKLTRPTPLLTFHRDDGAASSLTFPRVA